MAAEHEAQALHIFREWDVHGKGSVDAERLRRVFVQLGMQRPDVDSLLGHASLNTDGEINYVEFCGWLFRPSPQHGPQDVPKDSGGAAPARSLARMFTDASACPWLLQVVYRFLPWSQRAHALTSLSRILKADVQCFLWRWLCECLCEEALLHVPHAKDFAALLGKGEGGWRALFHELWPLRKRFVAEGAGVVSSGTAEWAAPTNFRLAAFCRMRPPATNGGAEPSEATEVSLPLHQRLALLKQQNPHLTHKEAMRQLMQRTEGGSKTSSSESSSNNGGADGLPGFVASVLSVTSGQQGSVLTVSPGIGMRNWHFDHVFAHASPQSDVFSNCGLRLAMDLLNGVHGALIVYGQTGSGKTHTMFGPATAHNGTVSMAEEGLVPRIAAEVLAGMEARRGTGFEVSLSASYVEVFGNDVHNLLGGSAGANHAANQRVGHRYILEGHWDEPVQDRTSLSELLERGHERKRQASTAMNERSSRAHVLVILRLRQRAPGGPATVESTLSLVDLGGSERVSKSKANENVKGPGAVKVGDVEVARVSWQEYYSCRERITETNHINKGLLTLKRCIQALNERQRCAKEGRPLPRIPFHDSKLTLLLEPALDGESRTSVVVCCSPEERHAEETVQSLRFGEMCSSVEHARKDGPADTSAAVAQALEHIDEELRQLEAAIRQKEHWEWRKTTRRHIIDEKDTGGTVCNKSEEMELGGLGSVEILRDDGTSRKAEVEHEVWGQVLTGAEAENARREELLKQRQRILGQE